MYLFKTIEGAIAALDKIREETGCKKLQVHAEVSYDGLASYVRGFYVECYSKKHDGTDYVAGIY